MLESMVNLYGSIDSANTSSAQGETSKKDARRDDAARTADVVQLAKRRIETMRAEWNRQRERDIADMNDRLALAERLATTDAARAAGIYQAIIDLHQGDTWAESVVAKARTGLAALKK
jgi:hypothetical protein